MQWGRGIRVENLGRFPADYAYQLADMVADYSDLLNLPLHKLIIRQSHGSLLKFPKDETFVPQLYVSYQNRVLSIYTDLETLANAPIYWIESAAKEELCDAKNRYRGLYSDAQILPDVPVGVGSTEKIISIFHNANKAYTNYLTLLRYSEVFQGMESYRKAHSQGLLGYLQGAGEEVYRAVVLGDTISMQHGVFRAIPEYVKAVMSGNDEPPLGTSFLDIAYLAQQCFGTILMSNIPWPENNRLIAYTAMLLMSRIDLARTFIDTHWEGRIYSYADAINLPPSRELTDRLRVTGYRYQSTVSAITDTVNQFLKSNPSVYLED